MLAAAEGIARKSAGLGPGGRPKSGITEGFADGCWALGGAGGADSLRLRNIRRARVLVLLLLLVNVCRLRA